MSTLLRIHRIACHFGGLRVIDDLSAELDEGRITALIGPNGAGKTTLFNLINGLLPLDAGRIELAGTRINGLSVRQITQRGVGRLFQDPRLFEGLSVFENLLVATSRHPGETPWGALLTPWRSRAAERLARESAAYWLDRVGLGHLRSRPAGELSFGQQKLVAIARLMVGESRLLLLDEPTAGVAPAAIDTMLTMLRDLVDEGRTLVVVEHNMAAVLELADWVHFLDQGRLLGSGTPADLLRDPGIRRTYLGT